MTQIERQPLYKFSSEAFNYLYHNFEENIDHYKNPDANFEELLVKDKIDDYCEPTGAYIIKPIDLAVPANTDTHMADKHAFDFYNSFEGMTPRLASDQHVLAYLNHFHLYRYGIARWPSDKNTTLNSMRKHWLTKNNEGTGIWKSSISGRTWWIAHVATKAAEHSKDAFDAKQALVTFAETPEYYHHAMEYAILKNYRIMSECVRALHNEAKGISRNRYTSMLREINRIAGARLIDSLNRKNLRMIVRRSANREMCKPKVSGRKRQ